MTKDQQLLHFERLVDKMRRTLLAKGDDYAGTSDRLVNFKTPAALLGVHTAKICLGLMAVKMSRLSSLIDSGAKPNFEAIEDTTLDLCVYAILNDAIFEDLKPVKPLNQNVA